MLQLVLSTSQLALLLECVCSWNVRGHGGVILLEELSDTFRPTSTSSSRPDDHLQSALSKKSSASHRYKAGRKCLLRRAALDCRRIIERKCHCRTTQREWVWRAPSPVMLGILPGTFARLKMPSFDSSPKNRKDPAGQARPPSGVHQLRDLIGRCLAASGRCPRRWTRKFA